VGLAAVLVLRVLPLLVAGLDTQQEMVELV
jgi:hypothetical protein